MDPLLSLLFQAAASPIGIVIRAGAPFRLLYQRVREAKLQEPELLGDLQIKAAPEEIPEGDYLIFKRSPSKEPSNV